MKTRAQILEVLQKVLCDHLKGVTPEMATEEANIKTDLGADSLDTIELVLYMDEALGFEISDEALDTFKDATVGETATRLFEIQPKG
ncbi:MAG: acyl carrier protein [Terrimicrobiaceae bacterium]|jgi:acyl carrier protein|nr:acyl carrier protein [Terrimicrobiaceae bacterium]